MIRTQIQLPEEDYERLRNVASRQGRSMADCIREGIDLFLRRTESETNDFSRLPAFHARPPEDLKDHDRWWAEAVAEGGES
ncbi:MAG: ribbon-helix-helix protein, CopG family [Armatimonadetes bacterium]|nr:ribbon-helix-helix protein, CopG family [Armatimonadota bacterium]